MTATKKGRALCNTKSKCGGLYECSSWTTYCSSRCVWRKGRSTASWWTTPWWPERELSVSARLSKKRIKCRAARATHSTGYRKNGSAMANLCSQCSGRYMKYTIREVSRYRTEEYRSNRPTHSCTHAHTYRKAVKNNPDCKNTTLKPWWAAGAFTFCSRWFLARNSSSSLMSYNRNTKGAKHFFRHCSFSLWQFKPPNSKHRATLEINKQNMRSTLSRFSSCSTVVALVWKEIKNKQMKNRMIHNIFRTFNTSQNMFQVYPWRMEYKKKLLLWIFFKHQL